MTGTVYNSMGDRHNDTSTSTTPGRSLYPNPSYSQIISGDVFKRSVFS